MANYQHLSMKRQSSCFVARSVWLARVLTFLLLWLGSGGVVAAQDMPVLFEPSESREVATDGPYGQFLRKGGHTGPILLNMKVLGDSGIHRAHVTLPGASKKKRKAMPGSLIIELEPPMSDGGQDYSRSGHLEDVEGSYVRLSVADGEVQGIIGAPGVQLWIEPSRLTSGVDTGAYDLLDIKMAKARGEETPIHSCSSVSLTQTAAPSCSGSGQATIRVLVLATEAARDEVDKYRKGLDPLVTEIFKKLNTAARDSNVEIRFEKVGPVVFPGVRERACKKMLELLRKDVASLRSHHRGDLVTLLTARGKCGARAYILNDRAAFADNSAYHRDCAFSVVQWSLAERFHSLAHEIGHNMGLGHDFTIASKSGIFDDSHGYCTGNLGPFKTSFETIMGQCPLLRLASFSNPSLKHNGYPTGVVGKADAADTLNRLRWTVSCYEQ